MFNSKNHRGVGVRLLALAALFASAGCGQANDQEQATDADPVATETNAASSTITVVCPSTSQASWIQAINGTVDQISGQTVPLASFGPATTNLECLFNPQVNPQVLVHGRVFPVGTVSSQCGAKVTFTGSGRQIGGVPPFGGWQFRSQRVSATASYDASSGLCLIQMPVVGAASIMSLRSTLACTPNSTGYTCPANALPLP